MDIFKLDIDAIKAKTQKTPMAEKLYKEAITYSVKMLGIELPVEPMVIDDEPSMKDGRFTDGYLKHLQVYDDTTWLFYNAFNGLAFGYKMTGKKEYLDKWLASLDACLMSDPWGPAACTYDLCSARLCCSLSVTAGWLINDLDPSVIERIDTRLKKEIDGFIETYKRAGDLYPLGPNNHQFKSMSGAGVAAIFLVSRHPEYEPALKRLIDLFKMLLPQSITPDGGWADGYPYYFYIMMEGVFFLDALKENQKLDLINSPGMNKAAEHMMYALNAHEGAHLGHTHVLFWIADRYNMPEALNVAELMLSSGSFKARDAAYSLICYNTGQNPAAPSDRVHIDKDFGLGRLGEGYDHNNVYLWMRSGPGDRCRSNQNGIFLTAYGKQILADTTLIGGGYKKFWDAVHKYGLWEAKNSTSILVNGLDHLKNRYGEDWEPIKKFHKPGRPKWNDDTMWWFDYEEPKERYGNFIGGWDDGRIWRMSASADRVFGELVSSYTRHCAMIDNNIMVIVDHIKANAGAETIWFRGNSPQRVTVEGDNICITADDGVNARAAFTGNSDIDLSAAVWEYQPETGGYFTAEMKAQPGDNLLVSAIIVGKKPIKEKISVSLQENDNGHLITVRHASAEYSLSTGADGSGLLLLNTSDSK